MSENQANFLEQILELFEANGWKHQLTTEMISSSDSASKIRVRLLNNHPIAPSGIVNDYQEGINPLEQIQSECLRALRTGRSGI